LLFTCGEFAAKTTIYELLQTFGSIEECRVKNRQMGAFQKVAGILGLFDNSASYLTSLAKCKAFCDF
jgi:hypothetical protein